MCENEYIQFKPLKSPLLGLFTKLSLNEVVSLLPTCVLGAFLNSQFSVPISSFNASYSATFRAKNDLVSAARFAIPCGVKT